MQIREVDLLIVGTGPAGTSTALHLLAEDPKWADHMVMIERDEHPRDKLCGGGVTHYAQNVLARLGLAIEPPNFEVREVRVLYRDQSFVFHGDPVFRIVRRREFDHWLVREVQAAGVEVRQNETVLEVEPHDDYVEVTTDAMIYRARTVVGADGSKSTVRRKLGMNEHPRSARLIEVITPESFGQPLVRDQVAVFDFTRMPEGVQGYYWDFPCVIDGAPAMNRGIFDSRVEPARQRSDLIAELRNAMRDRGRDLDRGEVKGHPIRWWYPGTKVSRPRVLLAGDAAGADPLFGEGISFALAYGELAAKHVMEAFRTEDFSFHEYTVDIVLHPFLYHLLLRGMLARMSYWFDSPRAVSALWHIIGFAVRFTPWRDPSYVPGLTPDDVRLARQRSLGSPAGARDVDVATTG